ncbi:MAG: glycosyltransferase family 1 protein [Micavibrio aeruginosavorus]|uniref:Glycosyltransferase family 1 protein n=1 Tax=Micavibrio aeruginosavorus TaxID=349221 RepID=A0A7T5R3R0_9BACT|nr:MAG: glycosyltransferase family 1 protein [Micavibrio aeruginosavorus]
MRILIISDAWHPQINGVVRTYEYLAAELTRRGHEVQVIGPHDFPWRMPLPGYREIELALFPYCRLSGMIEAFAPDSIHIATEGPLGQTAQRWCRRHNHRFSTAFHTMFPDYFAKRVAKHFPWLYRPARTLGIAMVKKFHNRSAVIITTTETINRELRTWGITAPLAAIPRGVPIDLFTVEGPLAIDPMKKLVALFVGRVAIEKNIEAFLNMEWEGLKIVVGDGPSLPALRAAFPDVMFVGKKTGADLASWYRSADVFVFPSRTDTFGIVLIEALSCGIPVAGYPVAGPQDIITTPLLGAVDDDLSQAVKLALQSTGKKEERHDYISQIYTWPAFTDSFLESLSVHQC